MSNPTTCYVESNAIDGDDGTYSTCSGAAYTDYLVISLTSAVTSTGVRVKISGTPYEGDNDANVLIEISPNGTDSWTQIHDGTVPNGVTHGWYEIAYSQQTVKAVRIKRNSDNAIYVSEVEFYDDNG